MLKMLYVRYDVDRSITSDTSRKWTHVPLIANSLSETITYHFKSDEMSIFQPQIRSGWSI